MTARANGISSLMLNGLLLMYLNVEQSAISSELLEFFAISSEFKLHASTSWRNCIPHSAHDIRILRESVVKVCVNLGAEVRREVGQESAKSIFFPIFNPFFE